MTNMDVILKSYRTCGVAIQERGERRKRERKYIFKEIVGNTIQNLMRYQATD